MLGYTVEQALQLGLDNILTPASYALAMEKFQEVLSAATEGRRAPSGTMEIEEIRADGSTVWVEVSYGGMYDESGTIIGIQGVTRNITEHKRMEEALRDNERYLDTIFNAVGTGILIVDPQTHLIADANSTAAEEICLSKDAIVGRRCP